MWRFFARLWSDLFISDLLTREIVSPDDLGSVFLTMLRTFLGDSSVFSIQYSFSIQLHHASNQIYKTKPLLIFEYIIVIEYCI